MKSWMLYGANGYTGRLIAEVAARRGLKPILAGRNRQALETLARQYSMECRVFGLEEMEHNLDSVSSVLLAAGPFVHTSATAVEACLRKGVSYLDITGEIGVFESLARLDARAKSAGTVILPGVGFDVVPSDCLAATLAAALPDAAELELAFSGGQMSRGTAKTMLAHMADGGAIRDKGQIRSVPLAFASKTIGFHDKQRSCVTIPWGDVSTAYHSTGIPSIRVYTGAKPSRIRQMKLLRHLLPVLKLNAVQRGLERLIEAKVTGPSAEVRKSRKTQLWGQVRDASGGSASTTLTVGEGYALTAECAVEAVERVGTLQPGFHTPSTAYGADFITEFEGCTLRSVALT